MKSTLFVVFLLLATMPAQASFQYSMPKDLSKVEIYLATRDMGREVYSRYGHTILRVLDFENQVDIAFNWGTFDFNAPGFIRKFLQGILIYQMSYAPWKVEIRISELDQQTMWMEKIRLTSAQKTVILQKLIWNMQPENLTYPYFFFYDNCSTRVRDLLDSALNGEIKKRMADRQTGLSYRDRVMQHNASLPFLAMAQDVILNSEPDKSMTAWEDMFVPIYLRDYLKELPAFDDHGTPIEFSHLLEDTEVLREYPQPALPSYNGYQLVWLWCGLPLLVGFLSSQWRHGRRLMGLGLVVFGSIFGGFGTFMALSWLFGSHTVLPKNVNLLLMWPLDFIYVIVGFFYLRYANLLDRKKILDRCLAYIGTLHLMALIVFVLGSSWFRQDTSRVMIYFAPLCVFAVWLSTPTVPYSLKQFFKKNNVF